MLTGNVLITGGAGFLGRGIISVAERENWPCQFTVYSRDETKQWELKHRHPNVRCILGDVARDFDRLIAVMSGHDHVIHAAAVKYIPEAEHNVFETIDVNINGSRNVALAAIAAGVKSVVGVSTDKASAPANLYGMTKAVMERMFAEANRMGSTRFMTVRYGNVVGSTGSVIPLFRRQAREDGVITVTHETMTRFWLSIEQAVLLVCAATADIFAPGVLGSTLIPLCGAMSILNLADVCWGLESDEAPNIKITGIRPGEKFHEALFDDREALRIHDYISKAENLWGNMAVATLLPAITAAGAIPSPNVPGSYVSSDPKFWITKEQMIDMIRDGEQV